MGHSFRQKLLIAACSWLVLSASGQTKPEFVQYMHDRWVDSLLQRMTLEQKIGQLFIVQAYSREAAPTAALLEEVRSRHVGGVLFMQGEVENQKKIIRALQKASHIPLLIAMDAENGLAFRLKNTVAYPWQMTLGALADDSLIFRMGREIGRQLRCAGVQANFAPVADVNNNPRNPVINYRSFGSSPDNVYRKAMAYARGLQQAGVLAVAKHFPGHGDTQTDSHLSLPLISKDTAQLRRTELVPFRRMIADGVSGMMTAHLEVPAFEPTVGLPSSLSPAIVENLLHKEFGFEGLTVTDAMNMKGVSGKFGAGEAAVRALIAGNDMLEVTPDLPNAIQAVKDALQKGRLTQDAIDLKCRRILAVKRWTGLHTNPSGLDTVAHTPQEAAGYDLTRRQLYEQALTLLRNRGNLLPLQRLDTLKAAVVAIGSARQTTFQQSAARYMPAEATFRLPENASNQDVERLAKLLAPYNLLICGVHGLTQSPAGNYGVDASISYFLRQVKDKHIAVCIFGNPYSMKYMAGVENVDALIAAYQENEPTQTSAAGAIFGANSLTGRLPVHVSDTFRLNDGIDLKKNGRLKYTIPEEAGISAPLFENRIDSIAMAGIRQRAYPGCQVVVARHGMVILNKCYGYQTYDNKTPVTEHTLYDLASVTKIIGPLPALMKLYGEKKINLDVSFSFYWPDFRGTDKEWMSFRKMLAHQARFPSGIIFWSRTFLNVDTLFQKQPSPQFSICVGPSLYLNRNYIPSILDQIRDCKLLPRTRYVYSDLPSILYPRVIAKLTKADYEEYIESNFFRPLGAQLMYNPYRKYAMSMIAPTENDAAFRGGLVHGYVHDEAAAMQGGVSGNAGLFATATDLAKMVQMYLQGGEYAGVRYLDATVVEEFTRVQYPENNNRRGLGFDKPNINNYLYRDANTYPSPGAGPDSWGHLGFTGTFVWADPAPDKDFLIIFLSNRIYPSRNNNRLSSLGIRAKLLQAVYDACNQ